MTFILRGGKEVKKEVYLPPGCVYIMSGDSLRIWHHAIFQTRINGERVSLTLRDVSPHKGEEEGLSPKPRFKQMKIFTDAKVATR